MTRKDGDQTSSSLWWWYILPVCVGWRVYMANYMPIMDCDEVYNYWEPVHFVLYQSGYQTWEYASQYALRTYAYILPMTFLARFFGIWQEDKLSIFLCLRSTLGGLMAWAEVRFCQALADRFVLPTATAIMTLVLLQSSAGMAHAAGAYLPSSTITWMWLMAATCTLRHQSFSFVIWAVTATLAVGWPFAVLVFCPLGLYLLIVDYQSGGVSRVLRLLGFTLVVTVLVQAVVMMIDAHYYGRPISPIWNIFQYNARGGGDEYYGVEPFSYYVKNLILNFNLAAPLGVASLGGWILLTTVGGGPEWQQNRWILLTLLSPLYLWMMVVFPRPHKEERFLFPIYPALCLGAAVSTESLLGVVQRVMIPGGISKKLRWGLQACICLPIVLLSAMRILALSKYYAAPLSIHAAAMRAPTTTSSVVVCTCGEWYRFPSSFALPNNSQLAFLPSSFGGQLPQPFSPDYGSLPAGESKLQPFNDVNRHEPSRYVSPSICNYVIDLTENGHSPCLDRHFHETTTRRLIAKADFLDATTSTLHRTLYLPFFHERAKQQGKVFYEDYVLYEIQS